MNAMNILTAAYVGISEPRSVPDYLPRLPCVDPAERIAR